MEQPNEINIDQSAFQCPTSDSIMEQKNDWEAIDELVLTYQKQFGVIEISEALHAECEHAGAILLQKFSPLFKKYINLLKSGEINFDNAEQRLFLALFIDDIKLRKALYSQKHIEREYKNLISQKFNFVVETYGRLDYEEIQTDLYIIFFTLAKRYKKTTRSFCCYVYNTIRYEVFRLVQKYTKNPANIHYRNLSYEALAEENPGFLYTENSEDDFEGNIGFNSNGMPTAEWFRGDACSEIFAVLTPMERKILSMYFLEKRNDSQIAKDLGIHVNTANQKRHKAIEKLASRVGLTKSDVKRTRNSGRKR